MVLEKFVKLRRRNWEEGRGRDREVMMLREGVLYLSISKKVKKIYNHHQNDIITDINLTLSQPLPYSPTNNDRNSSWYQSSTITPPLRPQLSPQMIYPPSPPPHYSPHHADIPPPPPAETQSRVGPPLPQILKLSIPPPTPPLQAQDEVLPHPPEFVTVQLLLLSIISLNYLRHSRHQNIKLEQEVKLRQEF